MITKVIIYLFNLVVKCHKDEVLERAAGLTYRVLLAFFPFLIFLMSLMGFLNLDESAIFAALYDVLPTEIDNLIANFISELSETQSRGLLSTALFFSVYNTTNGFRAIIRYTNRAYGIQDRRSFIVQVGLSFVLMILFSIALVVMLGLLVFGRQIWEFFFPMGSDMLFRLVSSFGAFIILVLTTTLIYKFACAKSLKLVHILPGATLTVLAWIIASAVFGFFIINFTQYPAIYGSIAGVFILILWLNVVSMVLLIGNEANSLLQHYI